MRSGYSKFMDIQQKSGDFSAIIFLHDPADIVQESVSAYATVKEMLGELENFGLTWCYKTNTRFKDGKVYV